MNNAFSILKFVNNPLTGESISLGLVAISNDRVLFKISLEKSLLAKRLNTNNRKLLEFSMDQLTDYLNSEVESSGRRERAKDQLGISFLDRLSRYNNGLLQFSRPEEVKDEIDQADFNRYFEQFIGRDIEELKSIQPGKIVATVKPSIQKLNIENKFINPLRDRIDTNITIRKKQLPSLFFDFSVDGLGVNGALYVVKSIDLSEVRANSVRAKVSEYESLLERLIEYSSGRGASDDPKTYLVMDPPAASKQSDLSELYRFLKSENMPYFKVVNSDRLDAICTDIIVNRARKFSHDLLPGD
jgi:hypothetical protein